MKKKLFRFGAAILIAIGAAYVISIGWGHKTQRSVALELVAFSLTTEFPQSQAAIKVPTTDSQEFSEGFVYPGGLVILHSAKWDVTTLVQRPTGNTPMSCQVIPSDIRTSHCGIVQIQR